MGYDSVVKVVQKGSCVLDKNFYQVGLPVNPPFIMNTQDRIKHAESRIKELELLIKAWKENGETKERSSR